jgi:hypothetical protein
MPEIRDISEEILEYLSKHPEASDTLEGIKEWWLMNQRISYEMKRVKSAISKLIDDGWVIEVMSEVHEKGQKTRYHLNPAKREELMSAHPTRRGSDSHHH